MNTEIINPEKMYTSEEITDYLRVSLRTTQRLLKSGLLPSFKVHGQYRIKGIDALNYLSNVRVDNDKALYENNDENKPIDLVKLLEIHPVEIKVNVSMAVEIEKNKTEFLNKVQKLREKITIDMGFICSGIRASDDSNLKENEYTILINGSVIYKGLTESLENIIIQAEKIIKKYSHEIISREEVFVIIEKLRKSYPVIVDDVLTDYGNENINKINIGELTKILKALLKEKLSIRNMRVILECIADNIAVAKNTDVIVNKIRESLSRQICENLGSEGNISVYGLSEAFEQYITDNIKTGSNENKYLNISLEKVNAFHQKLAELVKDNENVNLLCHQDIRKYLAEISERNFYQVNFIAYQEIAKEYKVKLIDTLF